MLKIPSAYKPYSTIWLYNTIPIGAPHSSQIIICPSCVISTLYHSEMLLSEIKICICVRTDVYYLLSCYTRRTLKQKPCIHNVYFGIIERSDGNQSNKR